MILKSEDTGALETVLQWKIPQNNSYQGLDSSFWEASVPRVTFATGPIKMDLKTIGGGVGLSGWVFC